MDGKTIGIIAVIIVVLVGGWIFLSSNSAPAPTGTSSGTPPVTTTVTTPVTTPVVTPPATVPAGNTSTSTTKTTTTTTTTTTGGVVITYSAQGFTPKSVTVPVGTKVTFVNQSGNNMWVASAPHPTHQGYDGTTEAVHCAVGYTGPAPLDECSAGTAFSFTFGKVGTWPYHNHATPTDFGMVTVVAATPI